MTLGGKVFALSAGLWAINGHDKTLRSVNSAVGMAALGAIIGGIAGGGAGAEIRAGIGGTVGLGSSAASDDGQAMVPAESFITFRLARGAEVTTAGQEEPSQRSSASTSPPNEVPRNTRVNRCTF